MPKVKSHRGVAKRFKVSPSGKIRRRRANVNHILEKKSSSRKRRLRRPGAEVSDPDRKRIGRLLGR
jgi:large subunit ribosomal protein L35